MNVIVVGRSQSAELRANIYGLINGVRAHVLVVSDQNGSMSDFARFDHAVARKNMDMIDVAVAGNHCHTWVDKALQAGIRTVLCTNPFGLGERRLEQIVHDCDNRRAHVLFRNMIALPYRDYRDRFGAQLLTPGTLRLWRRCAIDTDDGSLLDARERHLLHHDVGFLTWAMGAVERVYAHRTGTHDFQTHLTVSLRFASGMIGHLLLSFCRVSLNTVEVEVSTATRTMTVSVTEPDTEQESQERLIIDYRILIDHLRTFPPTNFGIAELRRQLSTLDAIDQSLETRLPVSLNKER